MYEDTLPHVWKIDQNILRKEGKKVPELHSMHVKMTLECRFLFEKHWIMAITFLHFQLLNHTP